MTLQECVTFLTSNGYLMQMSGLPYLSQKFYKDVVDKDVGLRVVERADVEVIESAIKPKKPVTLAGGRIADAMKLNWVELYSHFIIAAEIPRMGYSPSGTSYSLRLSTKDGREAFRKALLEGITYDELVERTKRYYQNTTMPVKVENFFTKELWRNDIEDAGDSFAGSRSLG